MASSPIKPHPPTKIGPPHQPLWHYLLLPQAVSCDVAHIAAKLIPWVLRRCAERRMKRYSLGGDSANNLTIATTEHDDNPGSLVPALPSSLSPADTSHHRRIIRGRQGTFPANVWRKR